MTPAELADEIERLWNAERQAEADYWRARAVVNSDAEYDQLDRLRSLSVEARGRAAALMVEHIDTLLAALRPPPQPEERVERAWLAYEAVVGQIVRIKGFADPQDRKIGIAAALAASDMPAAGERGE